jgi:hypothetical protein
MKYFYLIIITAVLFSCKDTPKDLEACFQSDIDTLNTGDSVLFTNCSVADTTMIVIHNIGNEQIYNGPAYNFTSDSVYIVFSDTGNFRATLRAWNMEQNTELKESYKTIRVN